jgi:hypothetical protein
VWIADASTILRVVDRAIDWPRLVDRATRLRATLRLRDALVFLRTELEAPIPEIVVAELERVRVTRRDVLAHRLAARSWPVIGPGPESVTRFLAATADANALRALSRLPSFLRDEWNLERRSQVPLAAARKGAARIGVGIPKRLRR